MTNTQHISQQVAELLQADGWQDSDGMTFKKRMPTGGQFGHQIETLTIDEAGRYLSRVDGWGNVERDVDLRNFPNDPAGAVAAVLK